jgi:hypothetical protein
MPDINMQVFEEVQRNQLVTEVDVQTQVVLDDYQVRLSDVNNPTKSQDNVVIDRFGEFLPHWNETLDFDTWVKMSMELAGKKLLMFHSNHVLDNESSGEDTFIQWHGVATADYHGSNVQTVPFIFENRIKRTVSNAQFIFGVSNTVAPLTTADDNAMIYQLDDAANFYSRVTNEGTSSNTLPAYTWNLNQYYKTKIIAESSSSIKFYDEDGTLQVTHTTNIPDEAMGLNVDTYQGTWEQAWAFIRKYTATEPTYIIGAPKNIATALKSLGRAG